MPADMFPLGEDVFLYVTSLNGWTLIHIRRFKKHGQNYYPTSEGVTLQPWCFDTLIQGQRVPETVQELPSLPFSDLSITSKDFEKFSFTRNGKCITINKAQWLNLLNHRNAIMSVVLSHVYDNMNFLMAYTCFAEGPIPESLPKTLDNDLGAAYIAQVLINALIANFKEKGLKQPEMLDCEELWGNRVETFNSFALTIDVSDIADSFYYDLWESQDFLSMKPVFYVTMEFLRNVKLSTVLADVRDTLCPDNAIEFYQDVE